MSSGEVTTRLNGPGTSAIETSAAHVLAERLEIWLAESPIADVTLCGTAGTPGALVEAGMPLARPPLPTGSARVPGSPSPARRSRCYGKLICLSNIFAIRVDTRVLPATFMQWTTNALN